MRQQEKIAKQERINKLKEKARKKWEEVKRLYFEKKGRYGKEEVVGLGRGNFKGLMCDHCLKTGKGCLFILCDPYVRVYCQEEDRLGRNVCV